MKAKNSHCIGDDHEIVLGAVKQDGDALYHASAALKDDREIVLVEVPSFYSFVFLFLFSLHAPFVSSLTFPHFPL